MSTSNQNARLNEIAHIQAHDVRAPLARIIGLVESGLGHLLRGDCIFLNRITSCLNFNFFSSYRIL